MLVRALYLAEGDYVTRDPQERGEDRQRATKGGATQLRATVSTEYRGDSDTMEETVDPDYMPTEDDIIEYAKWLGMDLEKDKDLPKEGLMAPLDALQVEKDRRYPQ